MPRNFFIAFSSASALALAGCNQGGDQLDKTAKSPPTPPNAVAQAGTAGGAPSTRSEPVKKSDPDEILVARVKQTMESTPRMSSQGLQITALQGTVKLFGTVDNEDERQRIGQVVATVEGVRSVDNQLKVGGG